MYQHQHAPLPLEELEDVPQPVAVLLEVLLEKDPRCRFQNPAELLRAMPALAGAIQGGRTITHQSLLQMPDSDSYALTRKPPASLGPENISIARLPVTGRDIFGREEDIAFPMLLGEPYGKRRYHCCLGRVGKSALVNLASRDGCPRLCFC
jgi:hypothetical protein